MGTKFITFICCILSKAVAYAYRIMIFCAQLFSIKSGCFCYCLFKCSGWNKTRRLLITNGHTAGRLIAIEAWFLSYQPIITFLTLCPFSIISSLHTAFLLFKRPFPLSYKVIKYLASFYCHLNLSAIYKRRRIGVWKFNKSIKDYWRNIQDN